MAKLLSTIIDGFISSKKFISGMLGEGWKIWQSNGKYKLELDDLVIRNTMTVFELLISKIRAIKGALGITQASGKIKNVREDENDNYCLEIEDEMSFMPDDIIRCLEFNGNKRTYWVVVARVEGNEIIVPKSEFAETIPQIGDELVQFGNSTDITRQSAIYLHADENGVPAIDVLQGISGKTFDGCTKVRVGGLDGITDIDFPGGINGYGIYCDNGYFKGTIAGAGGYLLRADGTGYICSGAIWWDLEKRVHFDGDVVLGWDNLSPDVQENLKGEAGKDGLSVFICYHDGDEKPDIPTGDGTSNGWHLAPEDHCVWMSQKVTKDVESGAWGEPIRVKGRDGDVTSLPWLSDWYEKGTEIGNEHIVSPRMFSGTNENEKLTGVAFGREVVTVIENGVEKKKTGVFGLKDGNITFSIDAETGDAMYKGELNVNEKFTVDKAGKVTASDVVITGGEFMGFDLQRRWLIGKKENINVKVSSGYDDSEQTGSYSKPFIQCVNGDMVLEINDPRNRGYMLSVTGNIQHYDGIFDVKKINATDINTDTLSVSDSLHTDYSDIDPRYSLHIFTGGSGWVYFNPNVVAKKGQMLFVKNSSGNKMSIGVVRDVTTDGNAITVIPNNWGALLFYNGNSWFSLMCAKYYE